MGAVYLRAHDHMQGVGIAARCGSEHHAASLHLEMYLAEHPRNRSKPNAHAVFVARQQCSAGRAEVPQGGALVIRPAHGRMRRRSCRPLASRHTRCRRRSKCQASPAPGSGTCSARHACRSPRSTAAPGLRCRSSRCRLWVHMASLAQLRVRVMRYARMSQLDDHGHGGRPRPDGPLKLSSGDYAFYNCVWSATMGAAGLGMRCDN